MVLSVDTIIKKMGCHFEQSTLNKEKPRLERDLNSKNAKIAEKARAPQTKHATAVGLRALSLGAAFP